jgi:hypothetical protein
MAAMCCDNDEQTYEHLIEEYIEQRYEGSPTPSEVSQVCRDYLDRVFPDDRVAHALTSSLFQLNFTTSVMNRESPSKAQTVGALLKAMALNSVARRHLRRAFKRGLFSVLPHPTQSPLSQPWDGIPNIQIPLSPENFRTGLLASGSIPLVLEGESSLPGSPPGHHFDGGLVDYHFEVETSCGPILFPHFAADPIPGWLDRFPPFRRITKSARDNLCVILPTSELLSRFQLGDYPGRQDFHRFSNDKRISLWRQAVQENRRLQDELTTCLEAGELLSVSEPLR